jgi:hypothetical protein
VCVCPVLFYTMTVTLQHHDRYSGSIVKVTGVKNQGKTATVLVRGSNRLVIDEVSIYIYSLFIPSSILSSRTLLHAICLCLAIIPNLLARSKLSFTSGGALGARRPLRHPLPCQAEVRFTIFENNQIFHMTTITQTLNAAHRHNICVKHIDSSNISTTSISSCSSQVPDPWWWCSGD